MAAFVVFYRTTEISPQHFEARVFVVPATEREPGLATRSECRIFQDSTLAANECLRMAEAMRNRLVRWGHEATILPAIPPPSRDHQHHHREQREHDAQHGTGDQAQVA